MDKYYKYYYKVSKDEYSEEKFHEIQSTPYFDIVYDDARGYTGTDAIKLINHWNQYGNPVLFYSLRKLTSDDVIRIQDTLVSFENWSEGKTITLNPIERKN